MSKRLPTAFETGEPDQHGASSKDDEHHDSSFERPRHRITSHLYGLTRRTSATACEDELYLYFILNNVSFDLAVRRPAVGCIVWLGEWQGWLVTRSFVVRQFVRMHTDVVGLGVAGKLDRFNCGLSHQ
jgi:hypothetical protein